MNEAQKQRLLTAVAVFNFSCTGWVLYRYLGSEVIQSTGGLIVQILIGAVIGGVLAGATYMLMPKD